MELIDLTAIWIIIIGFAVFMYVLLDGFDLGVGVLFPFAPSEAARDDLMNSVAPIWDGNETWLILGGTGLLAAFPAVYTIFLPALYLGVFLMLAGLIFRGIAFEFRFKSGRHHKHYWSWAFTIGSTVAALAQGIVVGAYLEGFAVEGMTYVGGPFDWLTPFTLFSGVALVVGYALLGATWAILKTDGETREWAYQVTPYLAVAVVISFVIISIWTPLAHERVLDRWLDSWHVLWPLPLLGLVATVGLWRALHNRNDSYPFLAAMGLFISAYAGLLASQWPYVVPPDLTFWDAASSPDTQLFLLIGILFLLPVIVGYSAWTYWVFRGKVKPGAGYQ